jgi:DNA-binding NarL/FixJ family response regulator
MKSDALVRLAELRRRQGRLAEATALVDQTPPHGAGLLERAELAFDCGDYPAAAERAEQYLRHVPTSNRTDRASGLEILVRALTCLQDSEPAKAALGELSSIASLVATLPLRAAASFASGYIAMGEAKWDAARRCFEDAVDLYLRSGAPFEVGRARIELARALGKVGRIEAALDEAQRAEILLSELKAELESARAHSLLEELATLRQSHQATVSLKVRSGELTRREIEILRLVAGGLNNQTIAERLFVSDHTVHRHLANILNKLDVSTRAAAVAQAARRGLLI